MTKQALFNLALKVFLFLSPIFFFWEYKSSYVQGMFFVFGSFALFGMSLGLEVRRKFSNPWLSMFLLGALIRVFVGGNFNSESEWFNFWMSSAGFIYILAGVLLFYTVYSHAEDSKNYLTPILAVCSVNLILVVAQLLGHDFMWSNNLSIGGFMGISSQLGQYSAMSIPVLAFISPWLVVIPLFTLYASGSISSIVALSAGIAFWGWQRKKKLMLFLIIPILFGCFNYKLIVQKWRCRPIMWEKTLRVILKRPYLGHGYRSFTKAVVQPEAKGIVGGKEYSRPHSDPLHTVQEMGFPIMIFVGGFFLSLWKKFKVAKKDALTYFLATSVLIVIVNGSGQTLIRYASLAGTFIVLLAFLFIKINEV